MAVAEIAARWTLIECSVNTDRDRKAAQLQYLAQQFRIAVLDILHEKGTGHWGGASSAAELLVALYFDSTELRPEEPALAGSRPAGRQQRARFLHALYASSLTADFSPSRR